MNNKSNSKFYEHSSYGGQSISEEDCSLNLNILPIIYLKDPNSHYRCPKCFNFPIIEFEKNQEDISYYCACSKNTKYLHIKDLFAPENENEFLTFLNYRNKNIFEGFLCSIHESDNSGKNKKFKYYCIPCNKNICKECLLYHLNKFHDVINFDFQTLEMNKKINLINKKLNELKAENEESENISFDEDKNNKTIKLKKMPNGNYKKIPSEKKKVTLDNFIELIKIIINDYMNYPNYFHFINIQNIYNILFDKEIEVVEDKDSKILSNEEGTVIFEYNDGDTRNFKCCFRRSIKGIFDNLKKEQSQFILKGKSIYDYNFIYNGKNLDIADRLEYLINEEDQKLKITKIYLIEKNKIKDKIQSKDIICPICGESIFINIKDYKINLFNCINKDKINNIFLDEFQKTQYIDLSKIKCKECSRTKGMLFYSDFYRCLTCKINICSLCKNNHDKNHKIIDYDEKDYFCIEHKERYEYYCSRCKKNICLKCESNHKSHNIIKFNPDPYLNKEIKEINELGNDIENLSITINGIINKFHDIVCKIKFYKDIALNICYKYKECNLNYQILQNIKKVLNFKNCISNDISTIIKEKDLKKKVENVMDLYLRLNNKNEDYSNEIISHEFLEEPQNLKFKKNIREANDFIGINELFEVFSCNNDHKEYIVYKNINNYNLDVYTLIDNKKYFSLKGHKNRITTIRYFIDNIYTEDEYLISADINGIVILWDIINNYSIKFQIDTGYNIYYDLGSVIFSCLLLFDQNNKDNKDNKENEDNKDNKDNKENKDNKDNKDIEDSYIIISINNTSKDINKSGTKIYSLNNGKFIKCIDNSNQIKVLYLLSWYNKRSNQYYIIQFGNESIVINSLSNNELYSEFIQKPEDFHYSGFIYKKNKHEYLLSCSKNGYINIWDLYNKNLHLSIYSDNSKLMSIIKWNDKYAIASDLNNSIKIIDIEKLKIVHNIEGEHTESVKCIKKIYLPNYGECLLSSGIDEKIKLWAI